MLESLSFTYDGVSCEEMGVVMFNPRNGLYQETFLPTRKILETKVNGRPKPYFNGIESEPLSFPLSIYIEGWKERNNLRDIARWLYKPYYKPLIFESNPERVFYAIIEGNSELLHNGCKDGYITLNVRCDSPFTYSLPKIYNVNVIGTSDVTLHNNGDIIIRPKLKITQYGVNDIKIKNNANGQEFILKNTVIGEVIEVDCANEVLNSSLESIQNKYLYNDHNDVWLDFDPASVSTFTFTGDFDIEMTFEYAYLAEDSPIYV